MAAPTSPHPPPLPPPTQHGRHSTRRHSKSLPGLECGESLEAAAEMLPCTAAAAVLLAAFTAADVAAALEAPSTPLTPAPASGAAGGKVAGGAAEAPRAAASTTGLSSSLRTCHLGKRDTNKQARTLAMQPHKRTYKSSQGCTHRRHTGMRAHEAHRHTGTRAHESMDHTPPCQEDTHARGTRHPTSLIKFSVGDFRMRNTFPRSLRAMYAAEPTNTAVQSTLVKPCRLRRAVGSRTFAAHRQQRSRAACTTHTAKPCVYQARNRGAVRGASRSAGGVGNAVGGGRRGFGRRHPHLLQLAARA